jgi:hypothetical protein
LQTGAKMNIVLPIVLVTVANVGRHAENIQPHASPMV